VKNSRVALPGNWEINGSLLGDTKPLASSGKSEKWKISER